MTDPDYSGFGCGCMILAAGIALMLFTLAVTANGTQHSELFYIVKAIWK